MFRNQSRKSPQFKQLVKKESKENFKHVRQFIKQKTSMMSSLPVQQMKKDKTNSTVLVVSRLQQSTQIQDNKTEPDYTPINSLIQDSSFQESHVQTENFSILQSIKCDTCQTLQQLYKSEISMLRNYCDYVKQESMSFQKQLHKLKQKSLLQQKNRENDSTQTEIKEVCEQSQMTAIDSRSLMQLQGSLLATQQFKNTLVKELESAHQAIDELEKQKLEIGNKLQKYQAQLAQKINKLAQKEQLIVNFQQRLQIFENIQKHSHGNQTQLTSLKISDIIKENRHLGQKSEMLERKIQQILFELKIDQIGQQDYVNQSSLSQLITQNIEERIYIEMKPLQQQISLLKQMMESQKRKFGQRQTHLQSLLSEAYQSIQSLLSELKTSKDEAKAHYFDILLSEKNKNSLRAGTNK